jgi:hypothetical protein
MPRIACGLDDILTAARQAFVDAGVAADAAAFLAVETDDVPPGPAEPPLLGVSFASADRRMDTLSVEEVGDDPVVTELELTAALWTRVALDQAGQDTAALTDDTLGLAGLVKTAIDALNARELTRTTDTLTWRPVVWLGAANRGRWKKDPHWRSVLIRFNVAFEWDLT